MFFHLRVRLFNPSSYAFVLQKLLNRLNGVGITSALTSDYLKIWRCKKISLSYWISVSSIRLSYLWSWQTNFYLGDNNRHGLLSIFILWFFFSLRVNLPVLCVGCVFLADELWALQTPKTKISCLNFHSRNIVS